MVLAGACQRCVSCARRPLQRRLAPGSCRSSFAPRESQNEQVHVLYVEQMAGGHLPVFTPGGGNYEAHQPPLYYAICAPVYMATRSLGTRGPGQDLARCLDSDRSCASVGCTFFAVRELFANDPMTALFAAMFVALLPMNVSLAASVSNDSLTNLVMALGLWQLARIAANVRFWTDQRKLILQALLLGAIMGAGIWTKTSTLLLFPVTIVVLTTLAVRQPESRRPALAAMAVACVGGVAIGLPWLVRNTMLYGDPVAQHIFMTAFKNTAHPGQVMPAFHCDSLAQLFATVTIPWTFYSFWGVFASMSLFLPISIYGMLLAFSLASIMGAILWIRREGHTLDAPKQAMLWGYAVLISLSVAALVRFNLVFFQAQGRYLYSALVPIATFVVIGLRQLEPGAHRYKLVGLFYCALLLVDSASVFLVASHFATLA